MKILLPSSGFAVELLKNLCYDGRAGFWGK